MGSVTGIKGKPSVICSQAGLELKSGPFSPRAAHHLPLDLPSRSGPPSVCSVHDRVQVGVLDRPFAIVFGFLWSVHNDVLEAAHMSNVPLGKQPVRSFHMWPKIILARLHLNLLGNIIYLLFLLTVISNNLQRLYSLRMCTSLFFVVSGESVYRSVSVCWINPGFCSTSIRTASLFGVIVWLCQRCDTTVCKTLRIHHESCLDFSVNLTGLFLCMIQSCIHFVVVVLCEGDFMCC